MSIGNIAEQKCPNCGAATRFDPKTGKLVCDYCDSVFAIEDAPKPPQEPEGKKEAEKKDGSAKAAGFDFASLNQQAEAADAEALPIYVCASCGAELIAPPEQFSLTCPYCGSNVVLTDKSSGALRPDGLIPFRIDKKDLPEAMNKFYKGKKLLPKNFFTESTMSKITGVYLPFWVFSGEVKGILDFTAQTVSESRQGDYEVTETCYYALKRDVDLHFDAVPVEASGRVDDALADSIEPFDGSEEKAFDMRYLAGFAADRFDRAKEDIAPRAKERILNTASDVISGELSGTYENVRQTGGELNMDLKARYLLYPVYLFNLEHGGNTYHFAVNGQTGKVIGELPTDKKVSFLYFALRALLATGVILAFFVGKYFLGW